MSHCGFIHFTEHNEFLESKRWKEREEEEETTLIEMRFYTAQCGLRIKTRGETAEVNCGHYSTDILCNHGEDDVLAGGAPPTVNRKVIR